MRLIKAAAGPVCKVYNNVWIPDKILGNIQDKPLFFIYSKVDTVVPPACKEITVITRLREIPTSIGVTDSGWRHKRNTHFFGGYLEITFYSSAVF
jgi:hypothetical protein